MQQFCAYCHKGQQFRRHNSTDLRRRQHQRLVLDVAALSTLFRAADDRLVNLNFTAQEVTGDPLAPHSS